MLTQRELDDFLGNFHKQKTVIKKVKYPALKADPGLPQSRLPIDFIDDVTVEIWAELGEASMTVGEILNMKEETVIELDKPAGETVNLKINGRDFARGEVIIIGNNLGIRVDRIYDPKINNDQDKGVGKNG
jgi:flagellar motor switch protein FliN/FliY